MSNPTLSFCIPVMNRLGDLKATLRKNLDDNDVDREEVEFIVVCFDSHSETEDWIRANFSSELSSGYLRFSCSAELETWHFGRAKNAFKNLARGRIYSSLDADNFTGHRGGRHIIDVFEANSYDCIFHQFQGDWGDGTCGRVSVTISDYTEIGYDRHFLPRQWDELDLILSTLCRHRSRSYVCYSEKSILKKSQPFAGYLRENEIEPKTVEIPGDQDPLWWGKDTAAVGKHLSSYVQDDPWLRYSSIFNHLTSFFKNCTKPALRNRYANDLVEVQREMAEHLSADRLVSTVLASNQVDGPVVSGDDVVLAACIKNESSMERWLDHYRRLGVTHFLLVDDGSNEALARANLGSDVWVWTPRCGQFRYSKAFWLEILLRLYADGAWAITADSDEYLDLPASLSSLDQTPLQALIATAKAAGVRYYPAILLDLVPGETSWPAVTAREKLPQHAFDHYQFRPASPPGPYGKHNTAKWSYGKHATWALRIDVRFRLNRALDSLRKFPLFQMGQDIHLNQGFHDLLIAKARRSSDDLARPDVLIIKHYKLYNTQEDALFDERRPRDAYHPETSANLQRLRSSLDSIYRAAVASPFKFQYIDPKFVPTPGRTELRLILSHASQASTATESSDAVSPAVVIPVNLGTGATRYIRGAIEAASLAAAADWVAAHTPYSIRLRQSESSIALAAC